VVIPCWQLGRSWLDMHIPGLPIAIVMGHLGWLQKMHGEILLFRWLTGKIIGFAEFLAGPLVQTPVSCF
jgi:hypothetical protein